MLFGLFQWRNERFSALQNFASSKGKSWTDYDTQIDFFAKEAVSRKNTAHWPKVNDLSSAGEIGYNYEVYGDSKPTFDMGKLDDLFEENYKKEEETELSQPLQWEDYMHPEFPWHNRAKWINNPKAVNFWMSAKGGTAKELNKLRKEEENTKTY